MPGISCRTHTRMGARVAAVLAFVLLCALTNPPPAGSSHSGKATPRDFTDQTSYRVTRIIDGDTLKLQMGGREVTVRLIGIDTPERERAGRPAEPYAHDATALMRRLCEQSAVYLQYDPLCARKDRYGRTLAHLFRVPDGLWVNREMVRLGMTPVYDKYSFSFEDEFREAEQEARTARVGIWSADAGAGNEAHTRTASDVVYVAATGRSYHRHDCRSLYATKTAITLAEARRRGLRACESCRPDDWR